MSQDRNYWERRLAESDTLSGVGWLGLGEPFNRWMYRVRRWTFVRRLRPLLGGRRPAVLDVGTGSGFYIERWLELGASSITGADLTDAAVDRLRHRFPAQRFIRLDIGADDPGLEDEGFDVISAMDVLFHLTEDDAYERAICNLARMLKPGGVLVFTENFVHGPRRSGPHQVSRSLDEIERLVREAGLVPLWRRPAFVLMNGPVDSTGRALAVGWRALTGVLTRWPNAGTVVGAVLAPLELLLVSTRREGPSTEMMACRKDRALT